MAYVKTNWTAGVTPCSEANMDHLETQYDEAIDEVFDGGGVGRLPFSRMPDPIGASGSYAGDNTADRAIPHGLERTPTMILIVTTGLTIIFRIINGSVYVHYAANGAAFGGHAVSAVDDTNFHVGNAANYTQSANANGTTYYWAAV